jgi:hypothetical protein
MIGEKIVQDYQFKTSLKQALKNGKYTKMCMVGKKYRNNKN